MSRATPEVLISYSVDAKPWAKKLSDFLAGKGIATWSDFENIKPGQRVADELQRALDSAQYFLIVVGPKKQLGEWQDREWQGALQQTWTDANKRMIPVLIHNVTPPSFLQNWGAVRIQPGTSDSSWMDAIYKAVSGSAAEGDDIPVKPNAQPNKALQARLRELETVTKQMKSLQER